MLGFHPMEEGVAGDGFVQSFHNVSSVSAIRSRPKFCRYTNLNLFVTLSIGFARIGQGELFLGGPRASMPQKRVAGAAFAAVELEKWIRFGGSRGERVLPE